MDLDDGFFEAASAYCPAPPAGQEDRFARLRLIRSRRVGPATFRRLMAEHGDAATALAALPDVALAAGVKVYAPCSEAAARAEIRAAKRLGAKMITLGDPGYPALLADCSDAPPLFWALGDIDLLARPAIAMVGTRNASSLGARMTRRLAADLSGAGFTIVSGLARGIDAIAHHAALDGGTIAVQAGGLDVIYPAENTELAHDIGRRGLRLSEQPFGLGPQARHFPQRNRIISGLARAVVVVEAAARSGSLITARNALDQGRDVLAVPGHPLDTRASGCNLLIRDGATLVRGAEDVIETLGPATTPSRTPKTPDLPFPPPQPERPWRDRAALNSQILAQLGPSPVAEDQLLRDLGLTPEQAATTLAVMELEGQVTRQPGGLISLGHIRQDRNAKRGR
ncbi:DNA-processing protein DprA [Nioella nitratireducens]|uniref:DNA-processing protein DprA n=1 Tax=Nioella nitratireducens TaxID=1287720 RepID=UPI0008FD4514|nr:DNA-processing protein DprA [Nioella nitratireducens]